MPTPPAAPCTSRRSPGRRPACVKSASWAVVKTSGTPPASVEAQAVGDGHELALVHRGQLGLPAAADDGHHAVALGEALGPGPARHDLAGELEPGDVLRRPGRRRVVPRALVDVGAVEPGRAHADEDLAGPRARGRGARRRRPLRRGWWRRAWTRSLGAASPAGTLPGMASPRRRMEARGHLAAGLSAPRRPRRDRRAAQGPLPRRGGAQARRPGLRARAARRGAGLLGAPGPGAAAAHLGPAPPVLQRARPRGRARPLHDAVAVRQRRDHRGRPAGRGPQLGARADPRRRRPPRRAGPRGRPRALRPRALPDGDAHPAAGRHRRAAAAARRAAAAGHPARAARVVPRRRAQLRPRRRARHPRPDGRLPRADGHLRRRGLRATSTSTPSSRRRWTTARAARASRSSRG